MDKEKGKRNLMAREDFNVLTADIVSKGILKNVLCGGDFRENSSNIYSGEGECAIGHYCFCRHNPLPVEERDKEAVIKISGGTADLVGV